MADQPTPTVEPSPTNTVVQLALAHDQNTGVQFIRNMTHTPTGTHVVFYDMEMATIVHKNLGLMLDEAAKARKPKLHEV